MKGKEVIEEFTDVVKEVDPALMDRIQVQAAKANLTMLDIHARVLACHCECLGMNAENCTASMRNEGIPYSDEMFAKTMVKWELVDEKGESLI